MAGLSDGSGLHRGKGLHWLDGGLGGAGLTAGAFSPLSLAPFIWLDPQPPYIFQDGLLTPAVNDGDPVALMLDRSGNGFNVTQGTPASRPLYRTSGGLHWLEFDGTDDFLSVSYSATSQPLEVVSGLRIQTGSAFALIYGDTIDGLATVLSGALIQLFSGVGYNVSRPDIGTDFVLTDRRNGASSRAAIDNGSYTSGNAGTNQSNSLAIGARTNGADPSNIRFSGLTQFDRLLTDPEIAQLRTYLASKQGRVL